MYAALPEYSPVTSDLASNFSVVVTRKLDPLEIHA